MSKSDWTDSERLKLDQAEAYVADMEQLSKAYRTIEDKLASLACAAQPGGIRYDRPNVKTSPTPDTIPDAVIRSIEKREELEAAREQHVGEFQAFLDAILSLESVGSVYLYDFYAGNHRTWGQVARYYNVDEKTCKKHREAALIEMYDRGLVPAQYRTQIPKAI